MGKHFLSCDFEVLLLISSLHWLQSVNPLCCHFPHNFLCWRVFFFLVSLSCRTSSHCLSQIVASQSHLEQSLNLEFLKFYLCNFWICFLISMFIYLLASGLSCSMWDLCIMWDLSLQRTSSLIVLKVKSLSPLQLSATPRTVVHQAPPSMEFSRQEYWSRLPFPSPGIFPAQGLSPGLPHCRQMFTVWATCGAIQ